MAGKIIADTLEHSTAGSLDTQYVVNGSSKAYSTYNNDTSTEGLNISTVTDNGVGDSTLNFTSAFGTTTYAFSSGNRDVSGSSSRGHTGNHVDGTKTASACQLQTCFGSLSSGNGGVADYNEHYAVFHGDLA